MTKWITALFFSSVCLKTSKCDLAKQLQRSQMYVMCAFSAVSFMFAVITQQQHIRDLGKMQQLRAKAGRNLKCRKIIPSSGPTDERKQQRSL